MKKVISFSLWGNDPKYVIGAIENIELQKKLFPSWTCRFYLHTSVSDNIRNKINDMNCEIIEKTEEPVIEKMNSPGMFWRFDVLKDKNIERFIVRDTDGRLTQREKNCVLDWELSGMEFHIIRDHVYHSTKIMGGMWGATINFTNKINYDELKTNFLNTPYNNIYAADQEFLAHMIYPLIKNTACIHDDWDRFNENARKVPHLRINNEFIGQPIDIK